MDRVGLAGAGNNIVSVKASGAYKVVDQAQDAGLAVHLREPSTGSSSFLSTSGRRWKDVANFRNAKPVSSGPYNVVTRFTAQDYVFDKNPHYWRKGMPKIPCLEYVQASSNDAALALIQSGQVDWTHNFVPNVEKAYIAKDPKHYHAFYATTAYPISLMLDTTKYPYSLVVFRKALSLRDRPQDRVEARRVRLRAADRRDRAERSVPEVGEGPGGEGAGEADGDLQPVCGEEAC